MFVKPRPSPVQAVASTTPNLTARAGFLLEDKMGELKATPGPWGAYRGSSYWEIEPVERSATDPYRIGDVCASAPSYPDGGLQEANAHLIAAAPEMYEMLASIAEYFSHSAISEYGEQAYQICALLAKARGENA